MIIFTSYLVFISISIKVYKTYYSGNATYMVPTFMWCGYFLILLVKYFQSWKFLSICRKCHVFDYKMTSSVRKRGWRHLCWLGMLHYKGDQLEWITNDARGNEWLADWSRRAGANTWLWIHVAPSIVR